jgi:hypothetical protein
MILVDLNQVMISNLMANIGNHYNAQIDENMIRHMVLNSLRANKVKFQNEFGEMIICADDKNYWRKTLFPYYKASRKKNREESELDWNAIFAALNRIREELKTFFPYKVIQIDTAEADDIIGTICHKEGTTLNSGDPILILSSDKDYIQLHKYANIKQFDPIRKRWISHNNPEVYLFEQIIKGDVGDGIPNVLSADNCLVVGERQRPITQKRLAEWNESNMNESMLRNFKRNESLIDLSKVPDTIKNRILEVYEEANTKDRSKLFNYFMENKLRNLMEHITEF